jgi:hypothetical protein
MTYCAHSLLQDAAKFNGCRGERADMVETSIAADATQAPPSKGRLIERFLALISSLRAAQRARLLRTIDRIRRAGLAHID